MKILFACGIIFVSTLGAFSQKLNYSIVWKGDSIGFITINMTQTDSTQYHIFKSISNFRVIFSFTTGYTSEAYFENGVLKKASLINTMNNDVNGSALVEWDLDKYQMVIDGEFKTWDEPITATVGMLYFEEPAGLTQIFSERYGRYLNIVDEGNGVYKLIKPDNRTNIYTYENGLCTSVHVNSTLTSFTFQLVK